MIASRRLTPLLLLLAGACLTEDLTGTDGREAIGSETAEIAGGTVVPVGELDAVARVNFFAPNCSGTLITDTIFLTAAHCYCGDLGTTCPATGFFRFPNVLRHDDPTTPENEERTWGPVSVTGDLVVHPDMAMGQALRNDLAVVRLRRPMSELAFVSPIPIAVTMPAVGSALTIVGFGGFEAPGGECFGVDGTKRRATTPLDQRVNGPVGDTVLLLDDPLIHGCGGDSGGPALDPAGRVAGVISSGDRESTTNLRAVPAHLEWIGLQGSSPGGRVGVWDVSGSEPAKPAYADNLPDPDGLLGWIDGDDVRLTGDFFHLGHDQVLFINRSGTGGRLRIADFFDGVGPTESLYWENYPDKSVFDGFIDRNDVHLVGDFLHLGHDQLLLMNRETSGRVIIVAFDTGEPVILYDQQPSLAGWHQEEDGFAVGDFFGDGYDTVLFVNRGVGAGRILIADFSGGQVPITERYVEAYADGVQLDGWHDGDDLLLAGDFRGLGRDQVLFVNRGPGNGRVLVADFSDGVFPAEWRLYLTYAQAAILNGWLDFEDVALAGRFRTQDRDQLALVNRTAAATGRVQVVDLSGALIAIPFLQNQFPDAAILPRIHQTDRIVAGDLRGTGQTQLLTLENLED